MFAKIQSNVFFPTATINQPMNEGQIPHSLLSTLHHRSSLQTTTIATCASNRYHRQVFCFDTTRNDSLYLPFKHYEHVLAPTPTTRPGVATRSHQLQLLLAHAVDASLQHL